MEFLAIRRNLTIIQAGIDEVNANLQPFRDIAHQLDVLEKKIEALRKTPSRGEDRPMEILASTFGHDTK